MTLMLALLSAALTFQGGTGGPKAHHEGSRSAAVQGTKDEEQAYSRREACATELEDFRGGSGPSLFLLLGITFAAALLIGLIVGGLVALAKS